jgi:hypothetical protein
MHIKGDQALYAPPPRRRSGGLTEKAAKSV